VGLGFIAKLELKQKKKISWRMNAPFLFLTLRSLLFLIALDEKYS